eukprot:7150659-Prymnesium_polylepis.1
MQETESGDGTNFVVVFAGELLQQAEELLKSGLHCSEVIQGYQSALEKCLETLNALVAFTPEAGVFRDASKLASCITPVIAAKQWGNEALFAGKIAEVPPLRRRLRSARERRAGRRTQHAAHCARLVCPRACRSGSETSDAPTMPGRTWRRRVCLRCRPTRPTSTLTTSASPRSWARA